MKESHKQDFQDALNLLTGANVQWNGHQKGGGVWYECFPLQSRSPFHSVDSYTSS